MHVSILHYAAPPIVGGVESTIFHHARLLNQAGYEVSIIAGRGESFDEEILYLPIPEIDSQHPEVIKVGSELAQGVVTEEFLQLRDRLFASLSSSIEDTDVLIVHNVLTLHKNLALTAALQLISEQGKPGLIAWCHDFAWQDALYTPDLHAGYPWDLLNSPWSGVRYVTVSEHRRKRLVYLISIPESEVDVIPPGVDLFQFLNLSPLVQNIIVRLKFLDANPLILLPARITRRKNIEFAIKVIEFLKINYSQVSLVITGPPGPHNPKNITYLNELRTMREDLGLISNVHFLYEFNGEDQILILPDEIIAELFRAVDIIIFPSHREGFGIPVLEAGLARTPIFASDIPSVRESSKGLINLFNPAGDPGAVAADIDTFLRSDLAYQLRRQVIEKYTWQSILKNKIIPILDEFKN
jgi:glycosyltransferase involved in cell wall biosynthesis